MERQQEYELRKKIADAIQNDVDRVFSEKLQLFNHDFYYEILFPLIVLEMYYKMKSEESLAAGLGDSILFEKLYIGTYIGCSYPIGRFRFQRKDMFLV